MIRNIIGYHIMTMEVAGGHKQDPARAQPPRAMLKNDYFYACLTVAKTNNNLIPRYNWMHCKLNHIGDRVQMVPIDP